MKHRFNSQRHAMTGVFALFCAAATIACSAQTTILQTSNVITTADTNWAATLTVPQFNSTLGTLTSVVVTLNWNAFQSVLVSNNDGASTDADNGTLEFVYADEGVNVQAALPGGVTLTGAPPDLILGTATFSTLTIGALVIPITTAAGALQPNTSISQGPLSPSGSVSESYTDPTNLALFTYSGAGGYNSSADTVSFPTTSNGSCALSDSGGNVAWTSTTQAGASISVTYTYTPAVVATNSCIQGVVINNVSGDGVCGHPTETGLGSGITIDVYDSTGKLVGTAVTAKNGTFEVTGLFPTTSYTVEIVTASLPKGYALSCKSNTQSITTLATGCVTTVDFAVVKCNTGCGYNTFCQSDWNSTENCNSYNSCLRNYYCQVYPDSNCTIGGNNASCCFDSCSAIENCLVQSGNCCPLPKGCQTDPRSYCNLGALCGETLACKLNCDFSDAGIFCSGFKNLTCQSGKFKGCTVSQVLHAANCCLNGDSCIPDVPHCSAQDLCNCLQSINSCYRNTGGRGGNNSGTGFCK